MPPIRYHDGAFPPVILDWPRLVPLLGPASAALARYDGVLGAVPNPQVLLSPLTTQEAVLSSRIEGTQTSVTEVLEFEAQGDSETKSTEKKADITEVLNYRQALRHATEILGQLPISGRIIRGAHAILLEGARGQNRSPGEYRRIQNWIGPPGCTEEEAKFVPISAGKLDDGMSLWERYLHSEEPDVLVQLAVLHAEFEALHPFLDGNGRLGRMLIPLFLFARKFLTQPTFYLSAYLEARRDEYYERLLAVSLADDWTGWCEFFLRALVTQADSNTRKAKQILELYGTKKEWVVDRTHSQHAVRALDFIFNRPIFRSSDFVGHAGIPDPTAKRILRVLRDEGLLRVIREGSGRRSAILAFPELLNVAEGRDVF
jgi:Fic family protein